MSSCSFHSNFCWRSKILSYLLLISQELTIEGLKGILRLKDIIMPSNSAKGIIINLLNLHVFCLHCRRRKWILLDREHSGKKNIHEVVLFKQRSYKASTASGRTFLFNFSFPYGFCAICVKSVNFVVKIISSFPRLCS